MTVDVTSERDVRDESARMSGYVSQLFSVESDADVVMTYVDMIRQLLSVNAGELRSLYVSNHRINAQLRCGVYEISESFRD